jgi:hypothetical protein
MKTRRNYLTPLLASGLVAAAIVAAPVAAAAGSSPAGSGATPATDQSAAAGAQQSCSTLGTSQTECQSPGNAQIYDSPPQVDYFPYAGGAT